MIEGMLVSPLKVFKDSRGAVMHMVRNDENLLKQFGEIYFSNVNPGVVKGWKKHKKMTQHFAVPVGNIKLVIYDAREKSSTEGEIEEVCIGEANYQLVRIPPMVWYSFGASGSEPALIANCTDLPHDPEESTSIDLFDARIPYNWGVQKS